MKNLYELKGNLTWDELKEKNDEYAIVAKDARLKRDVHNKKHDDEGNLTDGYKTIFNSVVHGTTTSVAETLYLDEDKFLDKVFPPNGILKTANVTDGNGQTVNDDYIRKQNNLPDDAQLTYTKTNWVNRYLNKDTDNNFRYTGNIDVTATWINEDGKPQKQNITTKDFTISTANKVNSDEIKDNLIRQKTNALEIINRNFDEQYKNAGTDLAKIAAINNKIRKENENLLEISMLEDPSFYRKMSSMAKTFSTDSYFKKGQDGTTIANWSKPFININRTVEIENDNGEKEYESITDKFIMNQVEDGENEGMLMLKFVTEEDGNKVVAEEGPFESEEGAMNVIYNYKMLVQNKNAAAKLGKTISLDATKMVEEFSEEADYD